MTGTPCILRRIALVALFAALAALPARGQNIPGSIEVTGVAGGYFGGKIYENLQTQVDTDTALEYGARLGVNITEGSASRPAGRTRSRTLRDADSPGRPDGHDRQPEIQHLRARRALLPRQ